jgi:Protein of unknown function (DUF4232)
MASAHASRALPAIAGILAAAAGVACGASPNGHSSANASPGASGGVAIPHGAVPWAPLPFQAYLPTPLPIPTAAPAPRCSLDDLTALPISTGGATGNEAVIFDFTNRTSQPCLTGGYPRVVLSQPGQRTIVATPGGFWDERAPALDLEPGAAAQFDVGFSYACEVGPAPPLYEHVAVTLAGGGSFTRVLTGAKPSDSQIPLGVFAQCGVTVTELSAMTRSPVYPIDPLLRLTATMIAPEAVKTGGIFTYVITLTNASPQSIALDRCRGYYQQIDSMKSPFFAYQLNCGAAHPIPSDGRESFVMEMSAAGLSAGVHSLDWHLDTDGASGPEASASFRVVP